MNHTTTMTERRTLLQPGERAPDFSLPTSPTDQVSLAEFRGQPVVLVFYPADFSPVCRDEMALYQAVSPVFDEYNAQVLGISVDGVWCHLAFAQDRGIEYPLLSDFEPKGEVARAYGAYHQETGEAQRALCVLDEDGVVSWSYLSPMNVNPGADGILAALEAQAAVRRPMML